MKIPALVIASFAIASCAPQQSERRASIGNQIQNEPQTQKMISNWAQAHQFNGVIAVKRSDGLVTKISIGEADRNSSRKLSEDSVFQTGSVGKLFVSIVAFALADEGKLDLDAPIGRYLPYYRKDIGEKVTVAHLMSNRSGIPQSKLVPIVMKVAAARKDNPDIAISDIPDLPQDIDATILEYLSEDLIFEPGSNFDYANSNWILVPRILERVTGKSVSKLLQQYVFEPSNMTDSGTFIDSLDPDRTNTAIGYDSHGRFLKTDFPLPAFMGGGTFTSAGDMLRFLNSLYNGKLLSSESLKRFSQIQTPEENYAFGGRLKAGKGAPINGYSWQSGSNGATKMVAVYNIDTGFSFVALSNRANSQDAMFELAMKLEEDLQSH